MVNSRPPILSPSSAIIYNIFSEYGLALATQDTPNYLTGKKGIIGEVLDVQFNTLPVSNRATGF
jgi:hypothetical protein